MDRAAFIMPVKLKGEERELSFFRMAVDSIVKQTDQDFLLIMIDDHSDNEPVYQEMEKMKAKLKDKIHVIYLPFSQGPGAARNEGIRYAYSINVPFILFLDSDDLADPRRLELTRKVFDKDPSVNVVYTSFDVIDENGNFTPKEKINPTVLEITEGHKDEPVEGEHAWIDIVTKKKYTNLTSCTAVRTSLAMEEPFLCSKVSEDSHTWMRYGAHPGKFFFLREIKGKYRVVTGDGSRSRSQNLNFYELMYKTDSDGFEQALIRAKKFNTMNGRDENDLRTAFHVRLALCLLHGGSKPFAKKSLETSIDYSKELTVEYIAKLPCDQEDKNELMALID